MERVSYNIQYTHKLDELKSYIMGLKEFIAFLQINGSSTAVVSMG